MFSHIPPLMTVLGSIRRQLFALAVAPFAVILAIGVVTAWSTWRERLALERASNIEMSRAVASAFQAYVDGIGEQSAAIGRAIVVVRRPGDAIRLLDEAARRRPAVRAFAWVGPDGTVQLASDDALVGTSVADRPEFVAVSTGAGRAVGNLVRSRAGGEVTFGVAEAVHVGGRVAGVVLATVDADRLDERALRLQRLGNAGLALMDAAGRLVIRSPRVEKSWADRDFSGVDQIRRALAGEEVAGTTASMANGEPWIGAAIPIPQYGWVARAGRSRAEVIGPIRGDLARAVGWTALAATLVLAASVVAGGRIARALQGLERHAAAVGHGEVPPRAVEGPAEIARLGRAFDEMAARLGAASGARDRLTADLERRRASYENTFRAAPVGMAVLDGATLRIRWANAAFLAPLDEPYRSAGVEGLSLEELVPGTRETGLSAILERVARDGVPYEDARHRHDGSSRGRAWYAWSVRPLAALEGGRTDLLVLVSDVTQQVVREVVLEAGAAIGQSVQPEEVADRVAHVAVPRLADFCSIEVVTEDGALAQLAVAHSPAADRADRAHAREHPLESARWLAARAVRTRRPVVVGRGSQGELERLGVGADEVVELRREGLRSWITVPLLVRGEPIGALTLASTQPHRVGRADVEAAEELARHAAQGVDGTRLLQATRRAVRNRDEVLAVVSHDLRTPLASVVMAASALAIHAERGEVAPGAVLTNAARIRRAGERMRRMLDDLLDLASLDEGRLAFAPVACAPPALVREAVEQARATAVEKGLELGWDAPSDLPDVRGDAGRILQVLGNLVSNAIKATEAGFVRVRAAPAGDQVRFDVMDSGPGIPQDELPRIFDRFRRGRAAAYHGTGLGLAIARGIVEAHGGRIGAESREGYGTRVWFTLPAAGPAALAADDRTTDASPAP